MFRNKRLEAVEAVLEAVILLLEQKRLITREEIQRRIVEDATTQEVEVGGITYRVDKED